MTNNSWNMNKSPGNKFIPLSPSEERFYLQAQLHPKSGAFNERKALVIRGCLKLEALRKSINAIIARHEVLRARVTTRHHSEKCRDCLCIQPALEFSLPVVDTEIFQRGKDHLQKLFMDEVAAPFDLASSPLFRMKLFRLSRNEHVLVISMHHMISDGDPSFRIIFRELSVFYEYFSDAADECSSLGMPVPRSELQPFPHAHGETRTGAVGDVEFWRNTLKCSEGCVNLPWKGSSTLHSQDFKGDTIRANLPQEVREAISLICQQTRLAETKSVFLALFQCVLFKLTQQRDISVGMPVFCRDVTDHVKATLGYYGNVIVVRTLLEPTETFQQCVAKVQKYLETGKSHERVPFQNVVKAVCPDWRRRCSTPLFNILFVVDQVLDCHVASGQVSFELTDVDLGQVPYDVVFTVRAPVTGALQVVLEYRSDRLTSDFMSTLLECFEKFTLEAAKRVDQKIGAIKLMPTEKALSSLLSLNRGVAVPYPRGKAVHEVFAEQVLRAPDSPALTNFQETTLTYRELEDKSNQLCCHLLSLSGTENQVPVGILLERSLEFVVAVLAVLKSGGVYVPLDPLLPQARLSLFVKKAGVRLIISQSKFKPCVDRLTSAVSQLSGILLEELKSLSNDSQKERLYSVPVQPEELAYIMFTSGSTGEPKAVEIPHRAIVRLTKSAHDVTFDDTTVSLLHSPLTFDASTFELWGPLCNGGRVVIAPPGKLSTSELSTFSAEHGINVMFLTSGIFNIMIDFHPENLRSVRQLVTGGDVMCPQRTVKAVKILPHCTITNGYGPTECTTFSSFYNIPDSISAEHPVPIGRPVTNTRLYVLDDDLSPVPPEAAGILFIGGDGLARGYRPHDDVSNEKFVPAPEIITSVFADEKVLFRTDDLVRVSSDPGDPESLVVNFLGRRDTQVKVSGIRVELREVEGYVRSHNAVRDAVVVQEGETAGRKILICYAALQSDIQSSELREFLKSKLPEYMIPSKFISVCEIPLTENGKVARRDLSLLTSKAQPRFHFKGPGSASPQSTMECCVASVWCEVLGMKGTGPKMEDNFFSIGGHSLLAQLAVAKISTKLGVEIPLLAVFNHPTLSTFVKRIEEARSELPELHTVTPFSSPHSSAREEVYHKISQQQEEYIDVYKSGNHTAEYHISAVFSVPGRVRAQPLEQCLDRLVGEHDILRAVYREAELGETLQLILPTDRVKIHVKEQSIHTGIEGDSFDQVAERAREDISVEFDFENGPLLRCSLYHRKEEDETTIVLSCNHMIMDDIALWIFAREMMAYYRDAVVSKPLPALVERQQYTTYTRAQIETPNSHGFCTSKDFWERELTHLPRPPLFPLSAPVSRSGGRKRLRVVDLPVQQLKKAASLLQVPPFAILLAANYISIYHVTGSSELCISFPVASRDVSNQRTIGTFARRIAVRLSSVASTSSLQDVVQDVAKNLVRVLEHQDYPMPRGKRDHLVSMFKLSYIDLSSQYLPQGARFHCLPLNSLTEDLVLFLDAFADESAVHVKICYLDEVLDNVTIDALVVSMETLFRCLAHDPDMRMSGLVPEGEFTDEQTGVDLFLARDAGPVTSVGCAGELFVRVGQTRGGTNVLGRYETKGDNTITVMQHTSRQVEINHHIVDLGFVESVALSESQVQNCTAVARKGNQGLCLMICVQATSKNAVETLRRGVLKVVYDELPDTELVQLAHIPLTPTGAVDTELLCRVQEKRVNGDYSKVGGPK